MLGLGFPLPAVARGFGSGTGTTLPLPVPLAPPAVFGVPEVGRVLSGTVGTWSGAEAFAWSWLSGDGAGLAPIPGAAGSGGTVANLVLTEAQRGLSVRLQVTASNAAGSRVAFSDAVVVAGGGAFSAGFSAAFAA